MKTDQVTAVCGAVHPLYQIACHREPDHESVLHFSSRIVDGLPREVVWSTRKSED